MALVAGAKAIGADFQNLEVQMDEETAAGTTTSGTYTATLTGGTTCALTFTAPPSGKIIIHNVAQLDNSSTQTSLCSWQLRTGTTIGAGTVIIDASDDRTIRQIGTNEARFGDSYLVTGLTGGSDYNVQQMFRGSGGTTATFSRKVLIIVPCIA